MWSVGLYVATLLAPLFIYLVFKGRSHPRNDVNLPPGSKGLPLIGETLQLLIPSNSLDLPYFIKSRIQRFGPIFQTRIVGRPVVVSADMAFNRYLVQHEGNLVEFWYLDTFSKLLSHDGEEQVNSVGLVHKYFRNISLSHFGTQTLKENLLPHLDLLVQKSLRSWSNHQPIDIREAIFKMTTDFTAQQLFGYDAEKSKQNLGEKFIHFGECIFSFPVNIPGTKYHKCLKNQREVMDMMKGVMKERLASPEVNRGDFLDHALKDLNTDKFLTKDFILYLMFSLLLASSETTSVSVALILKFLSEDAPALRELEAEHERILKNRESPDSPLTWNEVKSMTFTLHVINESLRLGNLAFGLLRRTLKDIEFNGYTIPAGWVIMLVNSANYYNPDIFKDPLTFNPWRWEDMKPEVISKNFMPFGGGIRQCAGAEFSKVLMTIFLHVLVTKYRWKKIKGGEISRTPFITFKNSVLIELVPKGN